MQETLLKVAPTVGRGQRYGPSGRLRAPDPGQPRGARPQGRSAPARRAGRSLRRGARAPRRSTPTTSSTPRSRRSRRASARCSSCATSWTFPKPRWRPHFSAPSAPSRARLLVDSRDSSRRCARPTTQGASHHDPDSRPTCARGMHERAARVHASPICSRPTTARARAGCGRRWRSAGVARAVGAPARGGAVAGRRRDQRLRRLDTPPTPPTPPQLTSADAYCARSVPTPGLPLKLTDTRGPFTFEVYADDSASVTCIEGPSLTAAAGSQSSAPIDVPAGHIFLSSSHAAYRGGAAYSFADGRAGDGVTGVTLTLDDGSPVQATVANGWYVAWWPSTQEVKSADITTQSGVTTQTLAGRTHPRRPRRLAAAVANGAASPAPAPAAARAPPRPGSRATAAPSDAIWFACEPCAAHGQSSPSSSGLPAAVAAAASSASSSDGRRAPRRPRAPTAAGAGVHTRSRCRRLKRAPHLSAPHLRLDPHRTYTVTIVTNCGTFAFTLDVAQSPKTSASFYALVRRGFFDGVTFHRVASGFVIQGGDPDRHRRRRARLHGRRGAAEGHAVRARRRRDGQDREPAGGRLGEPVLHRDRPRASTQSAGLTPDYALVGKVVSGIGVVEKIGSTADEPCGRRVRRRRRS